MAIKITEDCINCGACEPECPNNAIYEASANWKLADGTAFEKQSEIREVTTPTGNTYGVFDNQTALSDLVYYIVPDKCTECKGFHDEPQCAAVCPVDCCVPDENYVESLEKLIEKQKFLHF